MNGLKGIIYNCRQATFLIEKKQLTPLTVREKIELRIHLAGCSFCRVFQKQSIFINRMVKHMFVSSQSREFKLDEKFKQDMQQRINEKMRE